eukprot:11158864-Lingulodinium_polyedra.AAC.1
MDSNKVVATVVAQHSHSETLCVVANPSRRHNGIHCDCNNPQPHQKLAHHFVEAANNWPVAATTIIRA